MNKKLITLCVSALLAGGSFLSPAYATNDLNVAKGVALSVFKTDNVTPNFDESLYYTIRFNSGSAGQVNPSDWALKVTQNGPSANQGGLIKGEDVTPYELWKIVPEKHNGTYTGNFSLVNAAGIKLAVNDDLTFNAKGEGNTLFQVTSAGLKVVGKSIYLTVVSGNLDFAATASTCYVALGMLDPNVMSMGELNDKFASAFTLGIGYNDKDGNYQEYNLQGNPFAGDLEATKEIGTKKTDWKQKPTANTDEVYLWNDDKIVVLLNQKWGDLNNELVGVGYKFKLMTPTELAIQEEADALVSADKRVIRSYVFQVSEPNGVVEEPLEVAAKIPADFSDINETTWAELYVHGIDNIYYLTVASAAKGSGSAATTYNSEELALAKADYAGDHKVIVKFTANNFLTATDFYGKAWNIIRVADNKTLIPTGNDKWADKETVGLTVPEGQWILNVNADGEYRWNNRETTEEAAAVNFAQLRKTDTEDIYRIRLTDGTDVYYKITEAATLGGNHTEYYGADFLEASTTGVDKTYKIVFNNELGDPVYLSIDGVGALELTTEATAAVPFQAVMTKTTDNKVVVTDDDVNANYDVFHIINDYMGYNTEDKVWEIMQDTVSFNRYNLIYKGKYLHYDASRGYVLAEPVETKDVNTKDAYVIKEKGDDFVNVLNTWRGDVDNILSRTSVIVETDANNQKYILGEKMLANQDSTKMMYFDFNFREARHQQNIYNWVANAQLNLDENKDNIYRNVAPTAPDTMAIYRTEYQDEFLFEKNDFLGMTVDQRGYNAALFIDTAYVRNNTEKPLFMIGLRPEITPETVYCPIHGVNAGCAHEHLDTIPGYVDADYLTVLADSAAFHAAELQNEFLANSAYTKLAFIQARHNVDTITVADDNHKTTIVEGVQHPMVFAFRIVNQETKDFIIEGVDLKENKKEYHPVNNPYVTSWVRWNNGVPVMTDRMEDAEVFNIADDIESAPTANEAIEAEATVTVVATDGAVIVKGAEGKNVIVSTILGKVVANETVNSDNETIAAPAGIVVVSVDGESFKVAVK